MDYIFVKKTLHEHGKDSCCKKESSQQVCNDIISCSDNIVGRLEKGTGLKLHISNPTEKVNGYVSISHDADHHTIHVFLTETNEGRNERPSKMPTRDELEKLL